MIVIINKTILNRSIDSCNATIDNFNYSLKKINILRDYFVKNIDERDYYLSFIKKLDTFYSNINVYKNNLNNMCEFIHKYLISYKNLEDKYVEKLKNPFLLK